MGPDAQKILVELGLQTNSPISLANAIKEKNKSYYLRYDIRNTKNNKVVDASYLISNYSLLSGQFENGILMQVSEYIDTIAGAVLYVQDNVIYGEFVVGEPVLILRRGFCKRRFYISETEHKCIDYYQKSCFFQNIGYIDNCMAKCEVEAAYMQVISECSRLLERKIKGYLFEIHVTSNKIIFTDVKRQENWLSTSCIEKIFASDIGQYVVIKGNMFDYIGYDQLDIDKDKLRKDIYIKKGALLSHYVTYYNSQMTNIVFER